MKLSVEGYKSIASKQELDFDGLTILAGANSSGKSSFMQPFLILKQTIENHYDSEALILYGENAKLTDSTQLISKVPDYDKKSFSISMTENGVSCTALYKYKKNLGIQIDSVKMSDHKSPKGFILKHGMKHDEIDKRIPNDENEPHSMRKIFLNHGIHLKWRTVRKKCFIGAELISGDEGSSNLKASEVYPTEQLEDFITRLIHVPGLRGNPERSYKIAASEDIYPGSFEKYVASIITAWANTIKYKKEYELLKSQLYNLGLTNNIKTAKINDTSVEIQVSRHKTGKEFDCVNIADVGFGVSQTIPVLVALIGAKKGQFVYIEQPELHLHPKAQFKLAGIIVSAINSGVKVIIETHSSILIRGIQIAVATKELNHKKVSLNWFTQDPNTGATNVDKAGLDNTGAFGDWPEDFDETSLDVEKMYLDAVEDSLS